MFVAFIKLHVRMGLGQLISELIHKFLPGADLNTIANIMEAVIPTAEDMPLKIDVEELRAVLDEDAAVFEERQEKVADKTSGHSVIELEIAEQATRLRQAAKLEPRAERLLGEPALKGNRGEQPSSGHDCPPAAVGHWVGKGGARWTAKDTYF